MSASDGPSNRSLSEISSASATARFGVDLVSAARRNIGFLRAVAESLWLNQKPTLIEAIRRYDELWMPLISDLTADTNSKPPMILPPLDIEWVWFCHTLNPVNYKQYCESKFSKLIGKPAIFDEENEEYALNRCMEIWIRKYPSEPFENESGSEPENPVIKIEYLLEESIKLRLVYERFFSEPFVLEIMYLIAARQRYRDFLSLVQRFSGRGSGFVPASDILLIWLTHQSYPTIYAADMKEMEVEVEMGKVVGPVEVASEDVIEETKKLWERTFDRPYEKAGVSTVGSRLGESELSIYWEISDNDINVKYKSLVPRFLIEVCVMTKLNSNVPMTKEDMSREFLRLWIVKCHKVLKLDKPTTKMRSDYWEKSWNLYCEFGTKGLTLELRKRGGGHCFKGSRPAETLTFLWNDLLRARSLTLDNELESRIRVNVSITPPVQAPYLLKCVPDRVTDDSGAMVSDIVLKMNGYRPQQGRWLSRTVLDHAGRECFVVRMRIGDGFWRRGGETPSLVKWEDRIIEIRQGSWSYVAGSIGRAPEKVVGTASPEEPPDGWQASWKFSTGDQLMIRWDQSSESMSGLHFDLKNQISTDSTVSLLKGRKMQYRVIKTDQEAEDEEEELGFLTVVRYSGDDTIGRATALLNWKLLAVEFLPEEDVVFVLLLCLSILRSVTEMRGEDVGSLLMRRRVKETKIGEKDWGSVLVCSSSGLSSPFLRPWYWDAPTVLAVADGVDSGTRLVAVNMNYSSAEGGDKLYKRGINA